MSYKNLKKPNLRIMPLLLLGLSLGLAGCGSGGGKGEGLLGEPAPRTDVTSSSSSGGSQSTALVSKFTLSAGAYTIRAYAVDKEETTSIQATLLDNLGHAVPDGVSVKFVSNEQGQVGASCLTKNGACSVDFIPNGKQPADGRVQIFAYAQGSEIYVDNNSNKVFDDGDTFNVATMDMGEPYSDNNGNGKYDLDEFFVDANSNGKHDGPDGKWNGLNCRHSTLCSNNSQLAVISQQLTLYLATGEVAECEEGEFGGTLWVEPKGSISVSGLYLSDGNLNAKNAQGYGCLTGNSLPNGTKVEFSASAGTLKTFGVVDIADNSIWPNGPYSVVYTAADKIGIEYINLKITQPARGSLGEKVTTISYPVVVSDVPPDNGGGGGPNPPVAGSYLDPALNQKLVASISADPGIVSYGTQREVTLTFRTEAGVPQATTSTISASSACVGGSRAQISQPTAIDNTVKFIYSPKGCVGDDVLTFVATSAGKSVTVGTYKLVTEGENVGSIQFVNATPSQIPIATDGPNSGGLSTVTFKVVGPSGNGVSGEQVEFAIDGNAGGVTLVNLTDISDSQGLVRAQVRAGTTPNNVTVIATHKETKATKRSEGLTVASGLALKGNFTLALDIFNPNAYGILSSVDMVKATVAVRDASGNAVLDGTVVNFTIPEAGIVASSCQTVKGVCSVGWKPSGKQPADGRVRMATIVKASEHFTDNNGNLIFDDGDDFDLLTDDLPEPYVDLNEDRAYQVGEPFTDSNKNGVRDLADGKWNGLNCQHTTLCGSSKSVDLQESTIFHLSSLNPVICSAGNFGPSGSTLTVVAGETLSLSGLMLSDGNAFALNPGAICPTGNSLPNGTTITSKVSGGSIIAGGQFTVSSTELYPNGAYYIVIKAPTTAGTEALTINVGGREFFWTIKVTAPPAPTP